MLDAEREGEYNQDEGETIRAYAISPWIGVDAEKIGVRFGVVATTEPFPSCGDTKVSPTFHFRVGRRIRGHFDIQYLAETPYVSRGYVTIGFGSGPNRKGSGWLGLSIGPYDRVGLLIQGGIPLGSHVHLNITARLGTSEGINECVIGSGLGYHFFKD
jgi:hypothetical protein